MLRGGSRVSGVLLMPYEVCVVRFESTRITVRELLWNEMRDSFWKGMKVVGVYVLLFCCGMVVKSREDGAYLIGIGPIAKRIVEHAKAEEVLNAL